MQTTREQDVRAEELALEYGRSAVSEQRPSGAVIVVCLLDDIVMEHHLVEPDGTSRRIEPIENLRLTAPVRR